MWTVVLPDARTVGRFSDFASADGLAKQFINARVISVDVEPTALEGYEPYCELERHCNKEWRRIRRLPSVIQPWRHFYSSFYHDVGVPPSVAHRIERIDETQRWCAENVRWRAPRLRE